MAIKLYSLAASFWPIVFIFFLNPRNTNAGRRRHERTLFDAIYQLGDSLSDTGNFMRMNVTNITSCSNLPYGETYFGYPTGRCSDGLLMVDFFAKHLGLPLVKPYLDATADFRHGVDFAIYGATALSAAALEAKGVEPLVSDNSLPVEMGWFRTYLPSICSSSQSCRDRLRRSLFIMGEIGGNDINFAFFEEKSFEFVYSLIPDIIQAIKNATQEIIDVGATHILVPGNFPIGCVPIYRLIFASNDTSQYDDLKCLKTYNEVAKFQNEQIQKAIKELQENNPRVHIAYANFYEAYTYLLRNAASLGFEEDQVFNQCCGSIITDQCGTEGAPLCANPKTRLSWDGTHPTHQANKYMARWILSHTSFGNYKHRSTQSW